MIFTDERFPLDHPVRSKILQRPKPSPHASNEIRRDSPRIETLGALIGNGFEGRRQVRLLDDAAHLPERTIRRQERLRGVRRTLQHLHLWRVVTAESHRAPSKIAGPALRESLPYLRAKYSNAAGSPGKCGGQASGNRRVVCIAGLVRVHVARPRPAPFRAHPGVAGLVAVGLPVQ